MQLEIGKTYWARLGQKVAIIGNRDYPEHGFVGDNGYIYTNSGLVCREKFPDGADLIAEYKGEDTKPYTKLRCDLQHLSDIFRKNEMQYPAILIDRAIAELQALENLRNSPF